MLAHFLLLRRSWCRDWRRWIMIRSGWEVRYQTDYILRTDRRIFWNVSVREPRYNSDHYIVMGCLLSAPLREHSRYLGESKRPPLRPPTTPTREDGIFAALRRAVPKPLARDARKNVWISEATWRHVNDRVSARRDPAKDQALIRRLIRAITASLRGDRQLQEE